MKKYLIMAMAMLLALGTLAGCGNQAQDKKELQEVSIGVMPDIDSVPIIIAQEKGYFAEEGLKVDIQKFKSAMDRDAALQSGNLDGAISDMLAVAFAKSGGFDVKVLPDGWTVLTKDGSLSAHFEHTVVITPDGPKIMTVI